MWRDPDHTGAEPLRTCAVLTTSAVPPVTAVHDRMPVAIAEEDWDRWLDRSLTDAATVADLLRPTDTPLRAHRVSTRVNQVAHDDPRLVEAVRA